jgi:hypothetical protein
VFIFESPGGSFNDEAAGAVATEGIPRYGSAVRVLPGGHDVGSILQVQDWGEFASTSRGGLHEMKAIFTGVRIGSATNHQFQHTLGNRIYLNVFGDRITQLSLSGIAFYDNCGDAPGFVARGLGRAFHGINRHLQIGMSRVVEWYQANKLSNRPDPITVTIDPVTVYQCFLESLQGEMIGQESTAFRLFQFNMQMAAIQTGPSAKAGWGYT